MATNQGDLTLREVDTRIRKRGMRLQVTSTGTIYHVYAYDHARIGAYSRGEDLAAAVEGMLESLEGSNVITMPLPAVARRGS